MGNEIFQFLDKRQCYDLRQSIDRAIENKSVKLWHDAQGADIRIFNAERKLPEFQPLFEKMLGYYVLKYGFAPRHAFLMVNRIVAAEGNLGSGGGWHRDSWFRQRKVFVFLSDVNEVNGPLEYVSGTGALGVKLADFIRYRGSLRVPTLMGRAKKSKRMLLTLAEGHGVHLDTTVVHRGRPIREGVRYAATLYAFDARGEKLSQSKARFEKL
ncbi:hypothetical protein GRI55_14560 [Erythrobacter citreus]|uniref:Phytanoyl-CoA dioxygenase n=1 Tax=Qipengyuania citrea TaxID=225971 RepID=A0A6I4UHH3_9SPHN|nr:hypothetical protein [Qipengyuania citrea]MDQ0564868.1 hypothetical protein [Qipengyuania citrea]MXP36955.1 hypothetical protein [Qipengyuania citrea]